MDWKDIKRVLLGDRPPIPYLAFGKDELPAEGLTMGTLIIGKQGSGKTSSLARMILDYAVKFPNRGIFSLDSSGSLTDTILTLILQQPKEVQEKLLKRVVYDELGNREWVVPLPEFSPEYGAYYEDQVQRVVRNLKKLSDYLVKNAPILGDIAITETGSELFRLICAIHNEHGENWQITEAKKLLIDKPMLRQATAKFGHEVPEAKWYFEKEFLSADVKPQERELRSYSLRAILGIIEPRETRARLGYYRPGWTPKEAIDKGLIVLVSGENLINQESTQHYLFTQVYSLIIAEINKRRPANPKDEPVMLVLDEVYSLLQIPGMAEEIGKISPLYRSRKLELMVVIQALWQLEKELRLKIWSLGNVMCFAVHDLNEAYEIAQQLFKYDPHVVKMPARSETGQPIIEADRGQYLTHANWIQGLKNRECFLRRYISEKQQDKYIRYVEKTTNLPGSTHEPLEEVKENLLKERGIRLRDALDVVNQRMLTSEPPHLN